MGKRLIISEEERKEIRGKYNLMEQETASDGVFKVGDVIAYTPKGDALRQISSDVIDKIQGTPLVQADKYIKDGETYKNTNTKIGLSTRDHYTVEKIDDSGYYAKAPLPSTNTYILITREQAKQFAHETN